MSVERKIATGLLVATLAGCTSELPQQPTQEDTMPTSGLVEPTATIAPTETPDQYLERMTQEVAPTLNPIFAEKINNGDEVTTVDIISGDNLTLAEQGDDSKTPVTEQVGYISKLQVDTGHNLFTGEPVTDTEQLDTDVYIKNLLSAFVGREDIIVSTVVTTDTMGNALVELYVIDALKPQDPPSRVVLTQEGQKYAVALQTTWPDGSAVVVMLQEGDKFTDPTKVVDGTGTGTGEGITVITPTPMPMPEATTTPETVAEGLSNEEIKELTGDGVSFRFTEKGKIVPTTWIIADSSANNSKAPIKEVGYWANPRWDESIHGDPKAFVENSTLQVLYDLVTAQTGTQDPFETFVANMQAGKGAEYEFTIMAKPKFDGDYEERKVNPAKGITYVLQNGAYEMKGVFNAGNDYFMGTGDGIGYVVTEEGSLIVQSFNNGANDRGFPYGRRLQDIVNGQLTLRWPLSEQVFDENFAEKQMRYNIPDKIRPQAETEKRLHMYTIPNVGAPIDIDPPGGLKN